MLTRVAGAPTGLFYMLSPITLLLSTYHGQLHTVAVAAVVLALRLAALGFDAASGMALALGAGVRQHFAVMLVVLARGEAGLRKRLLLGFLVVFAALFIPLVFLSGCVECSAVPALPYGAWGYGMLFLQGPRLLALVGLPRAIPAAHSLNEALSHYANVIALVWPIAFALSELRGAPRDPWRASLVYILGLYVFTPSVPVQWLVWAVPFFFVAAPRWALAYNLSAGAFVLGSYWKWSLNSKHRIYRLTQHLDALSPGELGGLVAVGGFGLLTWGLCAWVLSRRST